MKARQSTRTPDIKELCSFDNSEEAEICVEVQKILADQPDMSVNEIKSLTDRRKPKVPRVDSGCGSPCIPSTVVTESESEEETALTDEETVESLCNVSFFLIKYRLKFTLRMQLLSIKDLQRRSLTRKKKQKQLLNRKMTKMSLKMLR